ncbi:hypothetical protein VCRA2113O137_440002 [Vibrio crassostreae]|nr:hypothetical protein VCRA2113O137_440002 [Vibrio crassostreae]
MTIKITEQKNILVIRRWKYSPERKRSLPTQIFSVSKWGAPNTLPADVISEHGVDADEQQTYVNYVTALKEEQSKNSAKYTLILLEKTLEQAKEALVDPELKDALTLDQYEGLSETVNDIKKLITKNKNQLKRKQAKEKKPTLTVQMK